MRATSPTSPTDDRHSHTAATASTEGQSKQEEGEGGMWSKISNKLVQKKKERRKRLWQNILKASLGDDWLIAPSPVSCHGHRQQVHFIHLYDNIYIVLTGGDQVFCQIHSTTQRRKAPLFQKRVSIRATAGRGRDVMSALTVRLSSTRLQL